MSLATLGPLLFRQLAAAARMGRTRFEKGWGGPVWRRGVRSGMVSPEACGVDVDMFMEERVTTDLLQMIETVY